MSTAQQPTAAAFYARKSDAVSHGAAAVPKFELYKVLREEELRAYRSVLRVFVMHSGENLSKEQRRVLEDLREAWCVPESRHDIELLTAKADSVVTAVHDSGVAQRREPYFDGVTDVPVAPAPPPTADDGFGIVVAASAGPRGAGASSLAGGRGAAAPASKRPAAGPSTAAAAGAAASRAPPKYIREIERIGEELREVGDRYIRAAAIEDRVALKSSLLERLKLLQDLRAQMVLEKQGGAGASAAPPQQGAGASS